MSDLVPVGPYREALARQQKEDEQARFVLLQELAPGERLLWAGRPRQGVRLVPADAYLIPFGVIFTVVPLVIAIVLLVTGGGAVLIEAIQGLAALLTIGVYLLGGRFFLDARRRAHTFYGLTDRRALLVEARGRRTTSIQLGSAEPMELIEAGEGRGTIRFGVSPDEKTPVIRQLHRGRGAGPSIVDAASARGGDLPIFEEVEDARVVYEHLREVHEALREEQARAALPRQSA